MKRLPGIKPEFVEREIVRPDGTVLKGYEMFVGDRSYGRATSKEALLEAWEASLAEAENAKPFAFRPSRKVARKPARQATRTESRGETSPGGKRKPAPPSQKSPPQRTTTGAKAVKKKAARR